MPEQEHVQPNLFSEIKLMQHSSAGRRDVVDASPGVRWNDIAGLEDAKRLLHENVVLPLYLPDYFQGIRRPIKARRLPPC
jgi:SpoVK/Ycf46/Vps4 family AAA+-type ATPase